MRALRYAVSLSIIFIGLNVMELRAEEGAKSSGNSGAQISGKTHVLIPGPGGKEQIDDIEGNPDKGELIYRKYCVYCHGKEGHGDGIAAIGLKPPPAALSITFLPWDALSEEAARAYKQRIFEIITYGLKGSHELEMPAWGPILSKQDRADVLAYIKGMSTKKNEMR